MVGNVGQKSPRQNERNKPTISPGEVVRARGSFETGGNTGTDKQHERWLQDHARVWIAGAAIALFAFMLVGLFALILLKVASEFLTIWLAALGSVVGFALTATAYYRRLSGENLFSPPNEGDVVLPVESRGPRYRGDRSDSIT